MALIIRVFVFLVIISCFEIIIWAILSSEEGTMGKWNPGDVSPATKTYNVVNKTGKKLNTVDVKKGQRFPPTQSSEYHYE